MLSPKLSIGSSLSSSEGSKSRIILFGRFIHKEKVQSDVEFVAEVLRYNYLWNALRVLEGTDCSKKEMLAIIRCKCITIINRFLQSSIEPRIQINVSESIANSIVKFHRNDEPSPTIFSEAFNSVLPHSIHLWTQYNKHLSNKITNTSKFRSDKNV